MKQKKTVGVPFKEGNSGRPKGATGKVNRLVKDVVSDVFTHLQTDPTAKKKRADLKSWAVDYPKDFYQIASKLIPVQMEGGIEATLIWKEEKIYEAEQKTDKGA